jgi:hypothetical protein
MIDLENKIVEATENAGDTEVIYIKHLYIYMYIYICLHIYI